MAGFTPVSSMIRNELADPIGVDQVIRKNRQTEFSNELARMAAETDQINASQFQRQNDLQAQRQQMQIDAAKREEYRQTGISLLGWLDQNQGKPEYAQMLQQLAADPESQQAAGVLGIDLTKLSDPAYRAVANAKLRAPVPERVQQLETVRVPGGGILQRDPVTGKLSQVVAPRAPAGGGGPPSAPSGYRWNASGGLEFIPGGPADPTTKGPDAPKDTEGTKRVKVLYGSLLGSEKQLGTLKGVDTSSIANAAAGTNAATRLLQSADYRRYESAALRWAANLLYIKSGATAPAEEVQSTYKQFFPQPGDPPDLQAQKAEARNQEMQAIADTYGLEAPPPLPPASPAPQALPARGQTIQHPSGAKVTILE